MPLVTVFVDGQVFQFTRTQLAARPFDWVGLRAREVRVTAQIRGREEVLLQYGGTWAVFKLFNDATWRNTPPTPDHKEDPCAVDSHWCCAARCFPPWRVTAGPSRWLRSSRPSGCITTT